MTASSRAEVGDISALAAVTDYAELLETIQPRTVTSQEQVDHYLGVIDVLTDQVPMSDGQREMVRLLAQLVHAWEAEHVELVGATPAEVVASLLEENGLPQNALVPDVFANRHNVSEFLAGRRGISYAKAAKLATFFHVSPAAFFPPLAAVGEGKTGEEAR
jgi:HTH-type transcriptional regulator/antitoxin HigA